LFDENTGMMDGFCKSEFENLGLQSTLQKVFSFETKNVIKLHASFIEYTNSDKSTEEGISFKKTATIFLWEGKKITSSLSDFSE
jgi:hypothetical protein